MVTRIKTSAAGRKAALAATLASVGTAALREGESVTNAVNAVRNALGSIRPDSDKPADKVRFAEVRHTYQSGRMAFSLFATANIPDAEKVAKARLARDAADADGKGNLKAGQTRRRTKVEQAAYNSAKTAWGRLLSAAGLKTSEKRGGNVTPKKPDAKPIEKGATVPAAVAAQYMPPKSANKETATAYVRQQLKLLSTFIEAANDRLMKTSTETLPVEMCSAVHDCLTRVNAVK